VGIQRRGYEQDYIISFPMFFKRRRRRRKHVFSYVQKKNKIENPEAHELIIHYFGIATT